MIAAQETWKGVRGTGLASVRVATGWCLAFRRSSRSSNRLKPTHQLLMPVSFTPDNFALFPPSQDSQGMVEAKGEIQVLEVVELYL